MNVLQQIDRTKSELRNAKPRSRRRVVLESRLRDLMIAQLRRENRADRRKAA